MPNFFRAKLAILLLCVALGRVSGIEFNQFDYKLVSGVQEGGLPGVVFKLAPDASSMLGCATMCTELGHLSFSYEQLTSNCRTYEESIDDSYNTTASSTVIYFTREVCRSLPSFPLATLSNISSSLIVTPSGTQLYPVGTRVDFMCENNHYALGGFVTCMSFGTWTGESTQTGCSETTCPNKLCFDTVSLSGGCVTDTDCTAVPSSVCTNGLCSCPDESSFDSEHNACITDCLSLYEAGVRTDGVYEIKPDGLSSVNASCDMSNGGWTVFQSHTIGDVDLATASWSEMTAGLGSPTGDHWIGLTFIHMLTWRDSLIYFDLLLLNDTRIYFQYSNFSVGNSSTMFEMSVAEVYLSNAYSYTDYVGFYSHNLMKFTTVDSDNDLFQTNCAHPYGPWWYRQCGIFGSFNGNFYNMNFWNVIGVGRVYVKQSIIKLRRQ